MPKVKEAVALAVMAAEGSTPAIAKEHGISPSHARQLRQGKSRADLAKAHGLNLNHPDFRITISDERVAAIRAASGSLRQIAAEFGVSKTYVGELRRREKRKGS